MAVKCPIYDNFCFFFVCFLFDAMQDAGYSGRSLFVSIYLLNHNFCTHRYINRFWMEDVETAWILFFVLNTCLASRFWIAPSMLFLSVVRPSTLKIRNYTHTYMLSEQRMNWCSFSLWLFSVFLFSLSPIYVVDARLRVYAIDQSGYYYCSRSWNWAENQKRRSKFETENANTKRYVYELINDWWFLMCAVSCVSRPLWFLRLPQ